MEERFAACFRPVPRELAAKRVLARLQSLPPQKRTFAWWPAALTDVSFAPAWPRVAAFAGAAVLGISIGLSNFGTRVATDLDLVRSRPPTMRAPTHSIATQDYAHDDDHDDAGSFLALALDRLARAEPVLHRHDRLACGAPLRDARATRCDGAPAHRSGAHRAAGGAAAGRRCRKAARGIPCARSRSRRRARRTEQGLRARARRIARGAFRSRNAARRACRGAHGAAGLTIRSCRRSC